jgi:hypothetical protein
LLTAVSLGLPQEAFLKSLSIVSPNAFESALGSTYSKQESSPNYDAFGLLSF